ncbi:MAG: glycosyltransferase [Bryobacterales bacterium]|nr:glycosyltransferase [Bryobacterales bacterium]
MLWTLRKPHGGKTICLSMIVRNECAVIVRALQSVKHLIDYWVIVDTGSTDSTPLLILQAMSGVPGELHRRQWINFGHNRTEAIRLAKGKSDYVLIMDADMVANVHAPFQHKLDADAYEIRYEGDVDYTQPMLVSNAHDWSFQGATHEFLHAENAVMGAVLPELTFTHFADGAGRTDKFERDTRLLENALDHDPSNSRNVFYLAQSYRDIGRFADALTFYEKRSQMDGWEEETWYAMYQAASMRHLLGEDWESVRNAYLRVYAARPSRLEPLYAVVKQQRQDEAYALGYTFAAMAGHGIAYPKDRLFIERPIYEYLFLLEYGVCAYGMGRWSEAVDAFNKVLRNTALPAWVAESAERGRNMALEGLYRPQSDNGLQNRIVVFTPFRNAGSFLRRCVESLREQDYGNFEVLVIDDASDDDSSVAVPVDDARFRFFQNPVRRGLGRNLTEYLTRCCQPDDIVVCVDGDDWLACREALTHINRFYNQHRCWVSYGQFAYTDGSRGFCEPFASYEDFRTVRHAFRASHVRTFRAGLFQRIADQDPDWQCFKDEQGEWLESSVDAALMNVLLELAGFDRVRFNDRVLYVYNDENPRNVHRENRPRQITNYALVSRKRPFARIDSYQTSAEAMHAGSL